MEHTENENKADDLNVTYLIRDNARLRAEAQYFDEMIRRADEFIKEV